MNAELLAALIVKVGLPAAEQLFLWIKQKKEVTPEDLDLLKKLADYTPDDALAKAGVKIVDGVPVKV